MPEPAASRGPAPPPSPPLYGLGAPDADHAFPHPDDIGIAITTPDPAQASPPQDPFSELRADRGPRWPWQGDGDGDGAALPDHFLTAGSDLGAASSIDHVLSTKPVVLSPHPVTKGAGPLVLQTYGGDTSPTARGEWAPWAPDGALQQARAVAVETC